MTPDPIATLVTLAHEAATEPDRVKRREVLTRMGALLQVAVDAEERPTALTNCDNCAHDYVSEAAEDFGARLCRVQNRLPQPADRGALVWSVVNCDDSGRPKAGATNCPAHKPRA